MIVLTVTDCRMPEPLCSILGPVASTQGLVALCMETQSEYGRQALH